RPLWLMRPAPTSTVTVVSPAGEGEWREILQAALALPVLGTGFGMVPGVQMVAPYAMWPVWGGSGIGPA
ncbi:MAG: hypothetical protein WBU92_07400, partial [Candidatus Dormiibacterota bacterium]